jgi:hypothetical protein
MALQIFLFMELNMLIFFIYGFILEAAICVVSFMCAFKLFSSFAADLAMLQYSGSCSVPEEQILSFL